MGVKLKRKPWRPKWVINGMLRDGTGAMTRYVFEGENSRHAFVEACQVANPVTMARVVKISNMKEYPK